MTATRTGWFGADRFKKDFRLLRIQELLAHIFIGLEALFNAKKA